MLVTQLQNFNFTLFPLKEITSCPFIWFNGTNDSRRLYIGFLNAISLTDE